MTILENSLEAFIFVNLQKGSVLPPVKHRTQKVCAPSLQLAAAPQLYSLTTGSSF